MPFTGTPADQITDPIPPVTPDMGGPPPAAPPEQKGPARLSRKRSFKIDKAEIVESIITRYDQDIADRRTWEEMRLQRYAKLRGWMEPKTWPWKNAANSHIPMIMADSLRTQDTIHNAVLGIRPVMSAQALRKQDADKTEDIDHLLDYQLFIEQTGEEKIGDLIDQFVNEGIFIAFIPWVKEKKTIADVRTFPSAPDGMPLEMHLVEMLRVVFNPSAVVTPKNDSFDSWTVVDKDDDGEAYTAKVEFYTTDDGRIQMETHRPVRVFDGPCVIPKTIEDVIVPARCDNLQPPGPSNPLGAHHVIIVDYPTYDEITRLQKDKTYDLMSGVDLKELEAYKDARPNESSGTEPIKVEKDALAGMQFSHNRKHDDMTFTRLTVYDRYDVNGDGLEEDVVFVVLKEARQLVRARYLTELYPAQPPRRPFACAKFIPVPGQFYAVSLIELMEHIHDLMKMVFDQLLDNGSLTNTPFFFYRAASGVRPETIRLGPGDGYPVNDPKNDVVYPTLPNPNQTLWVNVITLLSQVAERVTMVGELQLGRVPQGKASALRTASATQSILQQGDARPERILRRFFRGLAEIYQQMHELNVAFLPPNKYYKVVGAQNMGEGAYKTLDDPGKLKGRFQFDFKANVLNTNRAMHSQVMQQLDAMLINGLTMQLGIVTPDTVYTLLTETIKSMGEDPDKLKLQKPMGVTGGPSITAHEALAAILDGELPDEPPAEGAIKHLQDFMAVVQEAKDAGVLQEGSLSLIQVYMKRLMQMAQQEQQQMAMAQMAQQFQGGDGQSGSQPGSGGQPPQSQGPAGNPPIQGSEMMAEDMSGGGGGAMGNG